MANSRDLANFGDTLSGVSNVNIDSGTLFVDSVNNRVGVGTTSPDFGLEVVTANNNGIHLKDSTNTVFGGLFVESGVYSIRARSNHPMLFATNDTERMRIDSSGRIIKPYQPAFLAYRSDGSYTPGSNVVIIWNQTRFNIGSCYNTTNGRFTAPVTGTYMFVYSQYYRGTYGFRGAIYKNGGSYALHHAGRGTGDGEWTHSTITYVDMVANDYVDCRSIFSGELFVAQDHTWFAGHLVG